MRQILHINRGAFNLNVKHRAHICTNRDISHAADQDPRKSRRVKQSIAATARAIFPSQSSVQTTTTNHSFITCFNILDTISVIRGDHLIIILWSPMGNLWNAIADGMKILIFFAICFTNTFMAITTFDINWFIGDYLMYNLQHIYDQKREDPKAHSIIVIQTPMINSWNCHFRILSIPNWVMTREVSFFGPIILVVTILFRQ